MLTFTFCLLKKADRLICQRAQVNVNVYIKHKLTQQIQLGNTLNGQIHTRFALPFEKLICCASAYPAVTG